MTLGESHGDQQATASPKYHVQITPPKILKFVMLLHGTPVEAGSFGTRISGLRFLASIVTSA